MSHTKSTVVEVLHIKTNERYAMRKIPKQPAIHGSKSKIEWEKEVAAIQKINCRNILQIVDFFENDSFRCIVMELCKGGTLGSEIKKRKTSGRMFSENVSL